VGARVIRVSARDAGKAASEMSRDVLQAIRKGTNRGAERARAVLVRRGPRDQGQLRASWRVTKGTERRPAWRVFRNLDARLAELRNDAPHAGIVELGARPHPVSQEGIQALARWAMRNISFKTPTDNLRRARRVAVGPRELPRQGPRQRPKDRRFAHALQIARAIAWKIRHEGQKPTYYVRDAMPLVVRVLDAEVQKALKRVVPRPPPRRPGGPKGAP
jgi:hypothetical protein